MTSLIPSSRSFPYRNHTRAIGFVVAALLTAAPALHASSAPAAASVPDATSSGEAAEASFVAHGFRIGVAKSDVSGVWRITASTDADTSEPSRVRGLQIADGAVELNDATGVVTIRRADGRVAWRGRVTPLASFGRAQVPGLEIAWDAAPDESVYGLGERFDRFDQAGEHVHLWIEDAPGQGDDASRTYYASPLVYSSAGYAFFAADNPEGEFDLNSQRDGVNRYRRPDRRVTFYVATGDSLIELIGKRTAVQGTPRPIPEWAYGPWISKNSYESQAEAEAAIRGHLDRGNPVAAIVQEAWKGPSETGDFNNFSKERWPDVERFLRFCKGHEIHNVLWQVPIIHPSSPQFAEGERNGYFVKKPDGSISFRQEWLAGFANLDFTNPDAVKWWKEMMRDEVRMGVFGYKADDGEDIKPDDVFYDGRRGWQMHNEFSTLYNKALTELFDEEGVPGMLWARSGSLGLERFPALWAGDQGATWSQLRSLIPAGLSTGLSGMPYWGHDIGGYFGNATPELYVRWAQFGALSPLMQYHGVEAREPWGFGETADEAYKLLSRLRMNLKPTLVALGREASETGLPIMRPMVLHYPRDGRFRGDDTQYMLGPNLLVAPVMEEGAAGRIVKFPEGAWRHALSPMVFTGPAEFEVPVGLVDAPLFVREGAELLVDLAHGAALGAWTADAATRTFDIAAEPALVRDLRAPLIADPLTRQIWLTFESDMNAIEVTWHWADAPSAQYVAALDRDGARVTVDLTPPPDHLLLGRRQVYAIRARSAGAAVIRGEVDWSSPLAVQTEVIGSSVLGREGGRRDLRTTLRNRSGRSLEVTIAAQATSGTVEPRAQRVVVRAHGEAHARWSTTVPASESAVGDTRIGFTVSAAGVDLGEDVATLTRPGRWVVVGPFAAERRLAHVTRFPAEWSQSADVAFDAGNGSIVCWQQLPPEHLVTHGGVDFAEVFGPQTQAAAYAMTRLNSAHEQPVELRFGSDDTLRVWLNGEPVHAVEAYRAAAPDQEVVKVTLKRGANTIMAKVGQDVAGWEMLFRITSPGGAPARGVTDGFDEVTWAAFSPDRTTPSHVLGEPEPFAWRVWGPIAAVPSAGKGWELPSDAEAVATAANANASNWRVVPATAAARNRIDLNALFGATGSAVAYLAAEVEVEDTTDAQLVSGSDDGLTVWLNGQLTHRVERPRAFEPEADRVALRLRRGRNLMVCRVSQGSGEWVVQVDLRRSDGLPLVGTPLTR